MSVTNVIGNAISKSLLGAGFKKKSSTWYLPTKDTISICNLQRSSYGPQYYINIAVWLNELGDSQFPKEYQCQIRFRWNKLIKKDEKRMSAILDLDDARFTDEQRQSEIVDLFNSHILPFFQRSQSKEQLLSLYKGQELPQSWLTADAKRLLNGWQMQQPLE